MDQALIDLYEIQELRRKNSSRPTAALNIDPPEYDHIERDRLRTDSVIARAFTVAAMFAIGVAGFLAGWSWRP